MPRERRGRVVELVVLIQILSVGLSSGVQGLVDEHRTDSVHRTIAV